MLLYISSFILLCLLLSVIAIILRKWQQIHPYNQKPLDIKTFDGSDSPYHPAVLYFEKGWNGYKYWMAETPFSPQCKPYMDRNECPSIHVSNDGIKWKEIEKKPIDDLNEKEIKELDFFSDPHLVLVNGVMECWYRFTHRGGDANFYDNLQLVRKTSKDGVNWTERETLVNLATSDGDALGNMVVSPAIMYEKGKYRMWFVNSESYTYRGISYSESTDGYNWEKKTDCTLMGRDNIPWHIDVNYIDGRYYLISYDKNDLTLWESNDGFNFKFIKQLLMPSVTGSFYGYSLYRACIVKDEKYKIYFSGNDSLHTYIGLLEGKDFDSLKIVSNGKHINIIEFIIHLYRLKRRSLMFVTKSIIRKIKK